MLSHANNNNNKVSFPENNKNTSNRATMSGDERMAGASEYGIREYVDSRIPSTFVQREESGSSDEELSSDEDDDESESSDKDSASHPTTGFNGDPDTTSSPTTSVPTSRQELPSAVRGTTTNRKPRKKFSIAHDDLQTR